MEQGLHGKHAVTSAVAPFVDKPTSAGAPRITLLSPSPASLVQMFKMWDAKPFRARDREAGASPAASARSVMDLDALTRKKTAVDRAPAN